MSAAAAWLQADRDSAESAVERLRAMAGRSGPRRGRVQVAECLSRRTERSTISAPGSKKPAG